MYLRNLQEKDAKSMISWMHDSNVVRKLEVDFMHMELEDCRSFIRKAKEDDVNLHRAICTDDDEYLGTVSLKNISFKNQNAEYAIVICSEAMGKGVARFATEEILRIAFQELNLHKVYLCVKKGNIRARKFYEKIGFREEGIFLEHIREKDGSYEDLLWFAMMSMEYEGRFHES